MRIWIFCLLFIVSACSTEATKTKRSKGNLCRYAKHLQIFQREEGTEILIQHPDFKDKKYRFFVSNSTNESQTNAIAVQEGENLAVLSSTHIGMLAVLDLEGKITAVSDQKYVYNPKVKKALHQGKVVSLGDESQVSIEKLLKSKAKIIVYSAFSGSFSKEDQLKQLKITCIPDFDWRENTPLGRAEWLLLFAALEGKLEKGMQQFQAIKKNYLSAVRLVKNPKKVLVGNVTGDYWYAPAGESYMAFLMKDAGLDYLFAASKGTGSLSLSMEEIVQKSEKADLWLNPGFPSRQQLVNANPKARFLSVFKQGKIYCYTHDSNKFWEMSAVQPDLVLKDFTAIANGQVDQLNFYKQVK